MSPASFVLEEADGLVTITLDRPDRLNALTFQVTKTMLDREAGLDLCAALEVEAQAQSICMAHAYRTRKARRRRISRTI